jgi:hypothetical protein
MSRDIVHIGVESSFILGAGSSGLDGVPVLAAVKPGQHARFGRSVDRGCAPAGLAWMEAPRRMSLPDHGCVVITRPAQPAGKGEAPKPIRYERCLDSDMNDVLNQDTLSSTL